MGIHIQTHLEFTMDSCTDINGPSMLVIPDHPVTKACIDMKNRGVKMRFITEITKDKHLKKNMKVLLLYHRREYFSLNAISIMERKSKAIF